MCLLACPTLLAQAVSARSSFVPRASNLVIPQARSHVVRAGNNVQAVQIREVRAAVSILEQVATTTLDIALHNPSGSQQEAEMVVPVPEGAAVRGFTFQGNAKEPTAELLPKDEAKRIYESIVARTKDPALVEFVGYNLIRTSVFPVPARGDQKVRLTYEHLLPADGHRIDYALPRSESLEVTVPWHVTVRIRSKQGVRTTYSPSHKTEMTRKGPGEVTVKVAADSVTEPGPFVLSYLTETKGVAASLLAYPDPKVGGGYFLLLAAAPAHKVKGKAAVKREVTIVIDRSGSMSGDKIKQAKAAALQVLHGLTAGEAFNIIDYSSSISSFAPAPVIKDKKTTEEAHHYLRQVSAHGGTNIHDALLEALRQKPKERMLPIVFFLTDGLPTVGVRDEVAIRTAAMKANSYKRRIFSFGVGYDVNAPLLTHLATKSRAISTFVMPNEDVEVKVSQVYRRLYGPILSEPKIGTLDADGKVTTRRVSDVLPTPLPDLFEGDRLVLLGKYKEDEPLTFQLQGDYLGKPRVFKFDFELNGATTRNSFVPRLWASRKIGFLIEEIRQAGAGPGGPGAAAAGGVMTDKRMKELVDEIVRLSTEFGILTEYTAFLAKEGTDLTRVDANLRDANANLHRRAQGDRTSMSGFNQELNNDFQRRQIFSNRRNVYFDQNMNRVQVTNVQQISDRAFFQRGKRWIDSSTLGKKDLKPDKVVKIGSPAYFELVERLAKQNRQGSLSMKGEILLEVEDKVVLVE